MGNKGFEPEAAPCKISACLSVLPLQHRTYFFLGGVEGGDTSRDVKTLPVLLSEPSWPLVVMLWGSKHFSELSGGAVVHSEFADSVFTHSGPHCGQRQAGLPVTGRPSLLTGKLPDT